MAHVTELEADVQCIRCGYNLRGLASDGACPECGSLIERSLLAAKDPLSDPATRRSVWWSINFLQLTLGAFILAIATCFVPWITLGLTATGLLLLFVAGWRIINCNEKRRVKPFRRNHRIILTVLFTIALLSVTLLFVEIISFELGWRGADEFHEVFHMAGYSGICTPALMWFVFHHLKQATRRWSKRLSRAQWSLTIAMLLVTAPIHPLSLSYAMYAGSGPFIRWWVVMIAMMYAFVVLQKVLNDLVKDPLFS